MLIWDDELQVRNEIHCKYMMSLGYYGMGQTDKSSKYLDEVIAPDENHQGIQAFRSLIDAKL